MSQKESQSSSLKMEVLDFQYVALFRNHSASNVTAVENRGQISNILTTVKFEEGMGEMSE